MKNFFAKWGYTIAMIIIAVAMLTTFVAAIIACTGFIRVLAIASTVLHIASILAIACDMISNKPPRTLDEEFAEIFHEYKRDEDRA